MKRHASAINPLLGNKSTTTFRHMLSVLNNEQVKQSVEMNNFTEIHRTLLVDARFFECSVGPCYLDEHIPQKVHARFEELVVNLREELPLLEVSTYPN